MKRKKLEYGFSLLEMLISLAIFMVIAGGIIGVLINSQKVHRRSEISVSLEQNMRSALELMSQEVSQAGLQPSGVDGDGLGLPMATVVASGCTGTPSVCINTGTSVQVSVTSVAGMYVGEWLRVDASPGPDCYTSKSCEWLQIQSITTTTSPPRITFFQVQHTHQAQTIAGTVYPTPLYGMGSYPQGILPSGTTASGGSTVSQLELFGDLNGASNSLLLAKYNCPSSPGGAFTRTLYSIGANAVVQIGQTVNLIDNVVLCSFSYPSTLPTVAVAGCDGSTTEPVITSVGVSVTAQSKMPDPQTGRPVQVTKSFLNIQPRNITASLNAATGTVANELQPNPNPSGNSNPCQGLP